VSWGRSLSLERTAPRKKWMLAYLRKPFWECMEARKGQQKGVIIS